MRTPLSAIALSMLVGAFVQARDGVDFTGRWILETPSLASAETPHALSVRQSLVTTNVRGEPMRPFFKDITIERQVEGGSRAETHQIGVVGGVVGGLMPTRLALMRAPHVALRHDHPVKTSTSSGTY